MVAAALVAKKAVEHGLTVKPWVKTSLAPGSKVVSGYYDNAGLTPYLDKLGFNLVGYGCTTCIGNSGPLIPEVSAAVNQADLAVVSVLSGNRNFEGRISPDVKMNYLMSPPLVVAYALAGSMDVDLQNDPLGNDADGKPVYLHDIWPSPAEVSDGRRSGAARRHLRARLRRRLRRRRCLAGTRRPDRRRVRLGPGRRPTSASPRTSTASSASPRRSRDIDGARVLLMLGDSVTTDHISPAGNIKKDSPAGRYLTEHGVAPADFNSYGSRRGNDEVMVRGTLRQHPAAQPAGARHRGRRDPTA